MTIEWVLGFAGTAILAVIGWTLTASLASRMRQFAKIEKDMIRLEALMNADSTRISVLESQHNTVMASLSRIEGLLSEHLRVR